MIRLLRLVAAALLLFASTAQAGTFTTSTINLNGTPFDASSGGSLQTLTYTGGLSTDAFVVAYSYDSVNYYTLASISGASQTQVLTKPVKWLSAINASTFSGTLKISYVLDNGAVTINSANTTINLPNTGGAGTSTDTSVIPQLTNIFTFSYENGNPGNYNTGVPSDSLLLQTSPDNTNWTTLQLVGGGGCAVGSNAIVVQCYSGARYIRALYVVGSGQWPQPGGANQATLRLQMADKLISAGSATFASALSCPNGKCFISSSGGTTVGYLLAGINQASGAGLALAMQGSSLTAGTTNGGNTLISSGQAFAAPGVAGSIIIQPNGAVLAGNANGAQVTIDASPGNGTLAAVGNTIVIGGQAGQTSQTTIGDGTAETVVVTTGTKSTTISATAATAGAGLRMNTTRVSANKSVAPVAIGAGATATVTQLLDGSIFTSTGATTTLTLPSSAGGSGLVQSLPGTPAVGDLFSFTIVDSNATPVITVAASGDASTSVFGTASGQGIMTVVCRVTGITLSSETSTCYF